MHRYIDSRIEPIKVNFEDLATIIFIVWKVAMTDIKEFAMTGTLNLSIALWVTIH